VAQEAVDTSGQCLPPRQEAVTWNDVVAFDEGGEMIEAEEKGHLNKIVVPHQFEL
jgi:hypothetical protein